jgi:predicted nuclease of restriction endonuclease-like (RecB) superfamily
VIFINYYDEIKNELVNNEITKKVKDYSKTRSDLTTYYNVGKLLSEAGKHYGEGIIKEYSKRLTNEFGTKFGITLLKRIRQFYIVIEKGATMSHQLSWSHYCELLPVNSIDKINYYIKITKEQNLSIRELRAKIKNNEYERLDESTKEKLKEKEELKVPDLVKNPIQIKNTSGNNEISEKVLQKLILEDIPSFLDELGNGFTFVRNEYKIKIGDRYNYIDLLLFNYEFNCFVVVELKVSELKKEHIGQIEFYMNYIDKNLKNINQNKTIGIIICKKENRYVIEYCSDGRILAREYELI